MPVLPTSASEYTHYLGAFAGVLSDPDVKQPTFYKPEYPPLSSLLASRISKYADFSTTLLRDPVFCSPQRPKTRFIEGGPEEPPVPPEPICTSLFFSPAQDEYGVPFQSFLVVPNDGAFAPAFADFTVQWFQYMDSSLFQPFPRVFSVNDDELGFAWEVTNGTWRAVLYTLNVSHDLGIVDGSVLLDKWVFVSLVRQSDTYKLFINGVQTETFYQPPGPEGLFDSSALFIGQKASLGGTTEGYFGRLTNFHFAVGTVLTSVPTNVIQPVSGTKLLLDVVDFANRFTDSGPLSKVSTNYGVGWVDSNPFV